MPVCGLALGHGDGQYAAAEGPCGLVASQFLVFPGDMRLPLADFDVDVVALDAGRVYLDDMGLVGVPHVRCRQPGQCGSGGNSSNRFMRCKSSSNSAAADSPAIHLGESAAKVRTEAR
jgi:hypothetical protein